MPNERFQIGSLVRARGREWVVQPESYNEEDILILRPLGGSESEITGVYLPLEQVESATFPVPNPETDIGNQASGTLLRDAIRLGFRAGAGPFRSLAKIAIEPRPYQLVPLLLALRQDIIRLLIADDVGIGKTIEALMIARELLDRGEISSISVVCPPHLAEQWQKAMREQFHIESVLVLASTAKKLEKRCTASESLFDRFPFTVVSMDYIKSERRKHEFIRTCPELVIVDEAHTCAQAGGNTSSQKRHDLLKSLVNPETEKGQNRHMILVSATPHSGNQEAFRSLLTLLDPEFEDMPDDLSGDENRKHRNRLAKHLVQRRRGDLKAYLGTDTIFPERLSTERSYELSANSERFLKRLSDYCRERIEDSTIQDDKFVQRVRWWSALALLRAFSSSPKALASTLRARGGYSETDSVTQVDEAGRRAILDLDDEIAEGADVAPGGQENDDESHRERLLRMARDVEEQLVGENDKKLEGLKKIVKELLNDGYSPIIFCRFIPTVEYVADELNTLATGTLEGLEVSPITGSIPAEEREHRVDLLSEKEKRVLVCTDCLSEGINLQQGFDAVIHYDLSWNPTKHEQREGRVDRYGQPKSSVKAITYFGEGNAVDGIVLDVLLRKHQKIQKSLGISVPVPEGDIIQDAIYKGVILRQKKETYRQLSLFTEYDEKWDSSLDREQRSRSLFAQNKLLETVNNEVAHELADVQKAIGSSVDVERFVNMALNRLKIPISSGDNKTFEIDIQEENAAIKDIFDGEAAVQVRFEGIPVPNISLLTRTHPWVEGLSSYVLENALDVNKESIARRCSVIFTKGVSKMTVVLMLRLRYHIIAPNTKPLLAEDQMMIGFEGSAANPTWISEERSEEILHCEPSKNITPENAHNWIDKVLSGYGNLQNHIEALADERGRKLVEAHQRVRSALTSSKKQVEVDTHKPVDLMGVFVYLPGGNV